jgi:hypothetical protein
MNDQVSFVGNLREKIKQGIICRKFLGFTWKNDVEKQKEERSANFHKISIQNILALTQKTSKKIDLALLFSHQID